MKEYHNTKILFVLCDEYRQLLSKKAMNTLIQFLTTYVCEKRTFHFLPQPLKPINDLDLKRVDLSVLR